MTSSPGHSPASGHLSVPASSTSGQSLIPLNMEDLELLHHFATDTCKTLSDRTESHDLWRDVAPQIAFEHGYLMRGILAISALHLSILRPDQHDRFARVAVRQQDAALGTFRQMMSHPSHTSGDAFFAMSSLIVVYGFESPKTSNSLGMFDARREQSAEWLPLIRGVNLILQSAWPDIKQGRLNRLLHDHAQPPTSTEIPAALAERLVLLERCNSEAHEHDDDKQACLTAINRLRQCFIRLYNKTDYECEVSLAFLWPVVVPQRFIELVFERRPEALVILAYYCTILHHLDHYWWLNGWGRHIIGNIRKELSNDLLEWLEWPARVVGLPLMATSVNGNVSLGDTSARTHEGPKLEGRMEQQITDLNHDIKEVLNASEPLS